MLTDYRIRQRDHLLEIVRALTQQLDLDAILIRILRAATEMLAGRAGLIGLGYEGTSVIYFERDDEGNSLWFEVPLAGGAVTPFLRDADVDRLYFDETTGNLLGYLDDIVVIEV